MMRFRLPALAFAALSRRGPASATFHEIKVKEVVRGQSRRIRTRSTSSCRRTGRVPERGRRPQRLTISTPPGRRRARSRSPRNVGNGADQMTIFVATPDAATIFNITADLTMTAVLVARRRQGLLGRRDARRLRRLGQLHRHRDRRRDAVQCRRRSDPGLRRAAAARHLPGIPSLDACDDTDDSASDFITVVPASDQEQRNARPDASARPAATARVEGLERCDDNDTAGRRRLLGGLHASSPVDLDAVEAARRRGRAVPSTSNFNGVFEPGEDGPRSSRRGQLSAAPPTPS